MKKEIEELKCCYIRLKLGLFSIEEMLENSRYRTIKNNRKLKRLKNRIYKDMEITYKVIKDLGGI